MSAAGPMARVTTVATALVLLLGGCAASTKTAKGASTLPNSGPSTTAFADSMTVATATTVAPVAAATTTVPPKPRAANPCAGVDFRNFTFDLPDYGKITVKDGQGERGTRDSTDYAALQVRDIVAGDFGGVDRNANTAVFTNINTGGTGQLSDVHIYSCSGATATRIVSAGVGDRADNGVRGISNQEGALVIDRFADAQGACCPTAVVRQAFKVNGGALVALGNPVKRKYLSLDAGKSEVPISFLPGTTGAVFFGDTAIGSTGGFDAAAGQKLTLSLQPPYPNNGKVIIEVLEGDKVLGSAESGTTTTISLPSKAHYVLKPRPSTSGVDAGYDGEMTIT